MNDTEPGKSPSSLEKAKLLMEQKKNEKIQAQKLIEEEQKKEGDRLTAVYQGLAQKVKDLEMTKEEWEHPLTEIKARRLENIKDQRSTLVELRKSEEGNEILNDPELKKATFSDSENEIKDLRPKGKKLQEQIKNLNKQIEVAKAEAQAAYEQTPEYKQKVEKEEAEARAIAEEAERKELEQEQAEIAKMLAVRVDEYNFFTTGQFYLREENLKKAIDQYGLEKIKQVFDAQIEKQLEAQLYKQRSELGLISIDKEIKEFDEENNRNILYRKEYPQMIRDIKAKKIELDEILKKLNEFAPKEHARNVKRNFDDKVHFNYNYDYIFNGRFDYKDEKIEHGKTMAAVTLESGKQAIESLDVMLEKLKGQLGQLEQNPDFETFIKDFDSTNFGKPAEIKHTNVGNPKDGNEYNIKYNCVDKETLRYRGDDEKRQIALGRMHPPMKEKVSSIWEARDILKKGEEVVATKEKIMKDALEAQLEYTLLNIEAKTRFPEVSTGETLDRQFSAYENEKKNAIKQLGELANKQLELANLKDEYVSVGDNGNIVFTKNYSNIKDFYDQISGLQKENNDLDREKDDKERKSRNATMGDKVMGDKKKWDQRVKEIGETISGNKTKINNLENKIKPLRQYTNLDNIVYELGLDKNELMDGVTTLGDLIEKLDSIMHEKESKPFDPTKKEYFDKIKGAIAKVEQTKADYLKSLENI